MNKKGRKDVVKYAIITIMTVMLSVSAVFSNHHSVISPPSALAMHSQEGKFKNKKDDSDRLITNVKVFYNPISSQISTTFKLSKQSNVTIKVMDALGSEVLNLMNGVVEEGIQNLVFETDDKLSAGFYFVRLSSGTETVVKRISIR